LQQKHSGEGNLLIQIIDKFKIKMIRQNRELFLLFLSMALLMAAYQIHTPYEIIYINNYLNISKTLYGTMAIVPIIALIIFSFIAGKMVDKGHSLKLLIIGVCGRFVGLLLFSFVKSIYLAAVTMTIYYASLFIFMVAFTAWTKNLMPEDSRGAFEGIRMIFNVALPMIIGPCIGSALILNSGIPISQNGSSGYIPTPILFQVSAFASLTAIIPILFIIKGHKTIEG
jgi:MFS family permease